MQWLFIDSELEVMIQYVKHLIHKYITGIASLKKNLINDFPLPKFYNFFPKQFSICQYIIHYPSIALFTRIVEVTNRTCRKIVGAGRSKGRCVFITFRPTMSAFVWPLYTLRWLKSLFYTVITIWYFILL